MSDFWSSLNKSKYFQASVLAAAVLGLIRYWAGGAARWIVYISTAPLFFFLLYRTSFSGSKSRRVPSPIPIPRGIVAMKPRNLARELERRLQRRIGISTDEYASLPICDVQESSPLFNLLPRELRDLIWQYATAPFEDKEQSFEDTAYYYRPGHTACLKSDTNLLLVCRRIWLEAHAMPMLQAEHSYYYDRAAPDKKDTAWLAKLTDSNRRNLGQLHMFAQMCNIEPLTVRPGRLRAFFLRAPFEAHDFQPRMLHVTIRHTDWWYWESDAPLRLEDAWVKALLNSPDLRSTETLRLELETLDYKVHQLDPILERIRALVSDEQATHWIDGKLATTRFVLTGEPRVDTWEGPANIDGRDFNPYAGRTRLSYHVVTLTWKLHFMEYPHGFVPNLRLAARLEPPGVYYQQQPNRAPVRNRLYNTMVVRSSSTRPSLLHLQTINMRQLAKRQSDFVEFKRQRQFEDLMFDYERGHSLVPRPETTLLKVEDGPYIAQPDEEEEAFYRH